MLIKNKYKFIKKSKLDELRSDLAFIKLSKPSKKRTEAIILKNAKIMEQENINNKKQ